MLIKVMNNHNDMILVNPDHIVCVKPYGFNEKTGVSIHLDNGTEELIPFMSVEEFLVKTRETSEDIGKMVTAVCNRISHLEDSMAAGLQYIGDSCH